MQEIIKRQSKSVTDLEQKLEQSRQFADTKQFRTIRCPKCGFHMLEIGGYEHVAIYVKCRKCKFTDYIDTALFRTIRKGGRKPLTACKWISAKTRNK